MEEKITYEHYLKLINKLLEWVAADDMRKLIAARLYNSNELRRKVGDPEIPEAWANEYAKTKNYDWGDGGAASTTDEPGKKDG